MSEQLPPGYRENVPAGPPPGWYPDLIGRQGLRWWDGVQWGQQTRPMPGNVQETQPRYPSQHEQPRQSSFAPSPQYEQYGTTYQGQPQHSPPFYGEDPYPQGTPPSGQQPQPPNGHRQHSSRKAPRKRRRVFLWVFLAIQALFIIWIIFGLHSAAGSSNPAADAARYCANGQWYPLFKSQADCTQHYGGALADAKDAGTAIGVGLVIALWVAVDVILGISYGIYRLARRSA
jgi:Protein of unknown function (DUF2510)